MRAFTFALSISMTAAMFTAGCQGTVSSPGYGPDLVYVSPGVQVIADYDEPIFYSDRYYWRLSGGTWYRSPYYTRGWVAAVPPPAVMRIDRPRGYVHYRPQGWVGPRGPVAAPPPGHHYGRAGFEPQRVGPPPAQPRVFPSAPPRVGPQRVGPPPGPMAPSMRGGPPPSRDRRGPPHR
jgi:hypothetical protein